MRDLLKWVSLGLMAAAVVRELRTPAERRTWEGRVAGVVPYDFRIPSLDRAQARFWNPDDPRVFTPTVFGVGWAVNFARLAQFVRGMLG